MRQTDGGLEFVKTVAASGSALTIEPAAANVHDITLSANCTVTLGSPPAGFGCTLTLILRQDATGGRTVTWPGAVTWLGGMAPVLHSSASSLDLISLLTINGGTTWYGAQAVSPAPSFASAEVTTAEATSSSSYTDLTTTGPAATITVGPSGIAVVSFNAQFGTTTNMLMSVAVSGATTTAASDNWSIVSPSIAGGPMFGRTYTFTGLNPGSTTFTAKYRTGGSSGTFQRRTLSAEAK
jgi:hypothetical protein